MDGVEIARRLKKEQPKMKIIAVSSKDTMDDVMKMLDIGIEGFISKGQGSVYDIGIAVHNVMQGGKYFGRDIANILSQIYVAKKSTTEVTSEFKDQERSIISLSIEGNSAKMIADCLGLSIRTVEWHKSNIFKKLGINSTTEMVYYALKHRIIQMG
jgi:DNA-binding NarL/FixJ family response regulator